jgi:hypothetical protein
MRLLLSRAIAISLALLVLTPVGAAAHELAERYQAPLPLVAYVAGAAIAVAMSFAFVILREPGRPIRGSDPGRRLTVPAAARLGLRSIGLIGWLWIVLQAFVGGSSDADVASLFLWVYGWVGLALISALVFPVWHWLDPFSTLHAILSWLGERLGLRGGEPQPYPRGLGTWPAVLGFAFFVWLELVARVEGGRTLGVVLVGYTFVTLAGMFYFGRDTWRRRGETFSVWLGLLGRLAAFVGEGPPEEGRVRHRAFAGGLREEWTPAHICLLTLGTGAIIYDGISQTELFFDFFRPALLIGQAAVVLETLIAAGFMGFMLLLVFGVALRLGRAALGAGLLPVAVGYLIAHYLVFLLVDGQRMVHALNDPLQRGDNLLPFDLGFWQPAVFLPAAIVWTIQLAAVVGGHVLGAWAGHSVLARSGARVEPVRQLPLAALMVLFTSVTLWSLGQSVIVEPQASVPSHGPSSATR